MRSTFGKAQIHQIEVAVKGTPEIYPDDLSRLRLITLPAEKERVLLRKVAELEGSIRESRTRLQPSNQVIDEVICRGFHYPLLEYRSRERELTFPRSSRDFAKSWILRNSSRFHHPHCETTDSFFAHIPHRRVKAHLVAPIRLGATLHLESIDENGSGFVRDTGCNTAARFESRETPALSSQMNFMSRHSTVVDCASLTY